MSTLQSLRNAHFITRLVLVWFALFIGVSVASPLVKPQAAQMVCSAMGGMKMVNPDTGDDASPSIKAGMDCPLCMPMAAPAPALLALPAPGGLAYALHPLESARLASLIGPPWQARAPPQI